MVWTAVLRRKSVRGTEPPARGDLRNVLSSDLVPQVVPTCSDALVLHTLALDVWLRPDNLLDSCDALGADHFSLVGSEVVFTARHTAGALRWRGYLGERGVARI